MTALRKFRPSALNILVEIHRQPDYRIGPVELAALSGPVLISDRGNPTQVLLTFETYSKLAAGLRGAATKGYRGITPDIRSYQRFFG